MLAQKIGFSDNAKRAAAIGKRNQPVPHVVTDRVNRNPNLVAVEIRWRDIIFDMREYRPAYGKVRRGFQLQQTRQYAAKAAGVEEESGFDKTNLAVEIFHGDARALAADVDGDNFVAVTHLGALTLGFERQQMIEAGTLDLVRRAPTGRILVAEIKFGVLFDRARTRRRS